MHAFRGRSKTPPLIALDEWPEDSGRPRVLVEDPDGAVLWAYTRILDEAGYDVVGCQGPTGADGGGLARRCCPLLVGEPCPLVAGADVVVSTTSLPEGAEILEAVSQHEAPLVVSGPQRTVEARTRSMRPVTSLPYPVTREKLVEAVSAALEATPAA